MQNLQVMFLSEVRDCNIFIKTCIIIANNIINKYNKSIDCMRLHLSKGGQFYEQIKILT